MENTLRIVFLLLQSSYGEVDKTAQNKLHFRCPAVEATLHMGNNDVFHFFLVTFFLSQVHASKIQH